MNTPISCPHCSRSLPSGSTQKFCPHCGKKLVDAPPSGNTEHAHPNIVKQRNTPTKVDPPNALTQALPDLVKQLDTTATTNMTIAGVLIGFYAGAIFAGRIVASLVFNALAYALPICFLLATIILAIRVFYPEGYLTDDYATLIKKKKQRLTWSSLSLEFAVGLLILAIIVYLLRPIT